MSTPSYLSDLFEMTTEGYQFRTLYIITDNLLASARTPIAQSWVQDIILALEDMYNERANASKSDCILRTQMIPVLFKENAGRLSILPIGVEFELEPFTDEDNLSNLAAWVATRIPYSILAVLADRLASIATRDRGPSPDEPTTITDAVRAMDPPPSTDDPMGHVSQKALDQLEAEESTPPIDEADDRDHPLALPDYEPPRRDDHPLALPD